MTLQVLIATMHQQDYSLLEKMNIQSDAIVVNQCDHDAIERFCYKGHDILWLSMNERGVSLSRNTAFMRATADIILFADEDVTYVDDYPRKIMNAFINNPSADILLVDMEVKGNIRRSKRNYKFQRIRWYNSMRYGAVHFACKRERLVAKGLSFHLLFGGGSRYSCGEDSIFLADAMKVGMRVWTIPVCVGTITYGKSTWFEGYTEKYFFDKGVLMGTIFGKSAYLLIIILLLRNKEQTREYGFWNAVEKAFAGIRRR